MLEHVAAILDFVPHVAAHVNRRFVQNGEGNAVARAAVEFDDLFFEKLVFRADDQPGKIGFALEVVDDHTLDLRARSRSELRLRDGANFDRCEGADRDRG